jgi:hypothetical protein
MTNETLVATRRFRGRQHLDYRGAAKSGKRYE